MEREGDTRFSSLQCYRQPCTEKNGGDMRVAAWGGGGLFPIERVSRRGRRTFHTCVVVGLTFKSYACHRRRRSRDVGIAVGQARSTLVEASPIQTASFAHFFGRTLA